MTAAAILAPLVVMSWIERVMPGHVDALAVMRFAAASAPDETGRRAL